MTRRLVFDGDASQFMPDTGTPCTLCGVHQNVYDDKAPTTFIRVREKIEGGTHTIAFVCPNCVARMFLQVERLSLWNQVSGTVMAAIKRLFTKKWAQEPPAPPSNRKALGSAPGPKLPSRGLEKLLPGKSKS